MQNESGKSKKQLDEEELTPEERLLRAIFGEPQYLFEKDLKKRQRRRKRNDD